MKKLFITLFAFCMSCFGMAIQAQNTTPASGGNATGIGGSISYTIGQVIYNIYSETTGSVAQGVQQPYEISVITGLEESFGIILNCSTYPNPTTDNVTLKVENYKTENLTYQLYDINGILLENKKIESIETNISMGKLIPSIYFLKVAVNNKDAKTFKIIKK
jgi:hypothetical protein